MAVVRPCSLPLLLLPKMGPFPSQLVGIELWGWERRLSLALGEVGRSLDGSGRGKPINQRTEERKG